MPVPGGSSGTSGGTGDGGTGGSGGSGSGSGSTGSTGSSSGPGTARLVDNSGGELLVLTSTIASSDPIAVESWDLGFPDIRAVTQADPGADGEIDLTSRVGGRAITAACNIVGDADSTGTWYRRFRALMHPRRRYYLHLQRDGWSSERRILVRPDSLTDAIDSTSTAAIETQAAWRAPGGLWESVTATTVTINASGSVEGGMSFPVTFPLGFGTGTISGSATVAVDDEGEPTPPTWDLYGPCTNPVVTNTSTGEQFGFATLVLASGEFVRVDHGARTVYLNADANASRYGDVDWTVSTWWLLTPDAAQVAFVPASPGAGCHALLSWRDRWI